MKISDITQLYEAPVQSISLQQAHDRGMFGPVYHGTNAFNREIIDKEGFKVYGIDGIANSNGFLGKFNTGYPGIPPAHLLGYGVYFTPSKTVGKQYNKDTARGLIEYYLDVPRLEEIGFISTNTIWKWWVENGYNFDPNLYSRRNETADSYGINAKLLQEQIRATMHMTNVLKSKFDGVFLKKNSFRRGVDETQVVVFDTARIYRIDKKLASGLEMGSKVVHTQVMGNVYKGKNQFYMDNLRPTDFESYGKLAALGWKGIFRSDDDNDRIGPIHLIPPSNMVGTIVSSGFAPSKDRYTVKWNRGGIQYNYTPEELKPLK